MSGVPFLLLGFPEMKQVKLYCIGSLRGHFPEEVIP
jgi:hypothetical protein